jgi:hypothetical protein
MSTQRELLTRGEYTNKLNIMVTCGYITRDQWDNETSLEKLDKLCTNTITEIKKKR